MSKKETKDEDQKGFLTKLPELWFVKQIRLFLFTSFLFYSPLGVICFLFCTITLNLIFKGFQIMFIEMQARISCTKGNILAV